MKPYQETMSKIREFGDAPDELPPVCTRSELFAQARIDPAAITLFSGWSRLTTDNHGEMQGAPLQGFFAAETQYLTHYQVTVNGHPISHRLSAQLSSTDWTSVGAVLNSGDAGNLPRGSLPKGSIELRILRRISQGWSEIIHLRNNGTPPRRVEFELNFCCSIRDQEFSEETKEDRATKRRRGLLPTVFRSPEGSGFRFLKTFGPRHHAPSQELRAIYGDSSPRDGDEISRGFRVTVRVLKGGPKSRLRLRAGKTSTIQTSCVLKSREELRIQIQYEPEVNGERLSVPDISGLEPLPRIPSSVTRSAPQILSSNSTFNLLVGQAFQDLNALGLPIFTPPSTLGNLDEATALNAGIPRYVGLFGRDNLVSAWQSPLFGLDRIEHILDRVSLYQGVRWDAWRDEEPDRLPHECRVDPLSQAGKVNREVYYGDVTSTPFWIITLATLYRWSGEKDLLSRHIETLKRCYQWILRRLREGNGFIYYAPSKSENLSNRNQAWKDSGDAIVDEEGRICTPPLAVAEIQAYAYQALQEASKILRIIDTRDGEREARILDVAARFLKSRFNRCFWMPEKKFYALALDRDENPLRTIASNIGHCLDARIIDSEKLNDVVDGLMSRELFSGWGVRTLSTENPGYDPFSYHRGAVWPVENAFISAGLRAHGYYREADQITSAQFSLAALFAHMRLPEVVSGHARNDSDPIPGVYSFGNPLQAWSVSAIAQHVQSFLGIQPRADKNLLYVDPHLPRWIDWIELRHLRVGRKEVAIRFWRDSDRRSRWKLLTPLSGIQVKQAINRDKSGANSTTRHRSKRASGL